MRTWNSKRGQTQKNAGNIKNRKFNLNVFTNGGYGSQKLWEILGLKFELESHVASQGKWKTSHQKNAA